MFAPDGNPGRKRSIHPRPGRAGRAPTEGSLALARLCRWGGPSDSLEFIHPSENVSPSLFQHFRALENSEENGGSKEMSGDYRGSWIRRKKDRRGFGTGAAAIILGVVVVVVGAVAYVTLSAVSHTSTTTKTERSCTGTTTPLCAEQAHVAYVGSHAGELVT